MTQAPINTEKPAVTRDRIVKLLLKRQSTVAMLAEALGITRNAVRAQLALLEREGIVEVQAEEKGTRRPAAVYGLRPGAEVQPSRAYPVIFSDLIRILSGKLSDGEFTEVMRELGRRVAVGGPKPSGEPKARVESALRFLKTLGSIAEMSEEKGKIVITGFGCPIAQAVHADIRSCIAMESLLRELTGLTVSEQCDHGAQPSCRFEIRLPRKK